MESAVDPDGDRTRVLEEALRLEIGRGICQEIRAYLLTYTGAEWETDTRIRPSLNTGLVFPYKLTYYAVENPEKELSVFVQYSIDEDGRTVNVRSIEIIHEQGENG